VRTYFNADEFWQSLEVAHWLVFGYGHRTWEWTQALRGFAHPLLFAGPYQLLKLLRLDTPTSLALVPRVLQVRPRPPWAPAQLRIRMPADDAP
jgi:phosphatidylinositol glycan class B